MGPPESQSEVARLLLTTDAVRELDRRWAAHLLRRLAGRGPGTRARGVGAVVGVVQGGFRQLV